MVRKILYISWDSDSVNYLESLFLPIFIGMKNEGYEVDVLQLSWSGGDAIKKRRSLFKSVSINYHHIAIPRCCGRVLGSLFAVVAGRVYVRYLQKNRNYSILMPRAVMASLIVPRLPHTNIYFDYDGLDVDERVDRGELRRGSFLYYALRVAEQRALSVSSKIFTRSQVAIDIIKNRLGNSTDIEFHKVINGRDEATFKILEGDDIRRIRGELGIKQNDFVFCYVGSIGPQYNINKMLTIFEKFSSVNKNSFFIFVTFGKSELFNIISSDFPNLLDNNRIIVVSGNQLDVVKFVNASDVCFSLRLACFSMQAVAPLKTSEYLMCGKAVIANVKSIGDTNLFFNDICGLNVDDMTVDDIIAWCRYKFVEGYDFDHSTMRRSIALKYGALNAGVRSYIDAVN